MNISLKKLWPLVKILVWVLIAFAVGFQFWKILELEALKNPDSNQNPLELLWQQMQDASFLGVLGCGFLYIVGIGFSGWFWADLLKDANQPLPFLVALRCYYIAQLGKYVPGKGLALFLRVTLAMEGGVQAAVGAVTSVYEVLVTMAAGATLAVILGLIIPDIPSTQLTAALVLMAVAGVPVIPGFFPRLAKKLAGRFLEKDKELYIPDSFRSFFRGMISTMIGWAFLGASLTLLWQAMDTSVDGLTLTRWIWCTGCITIANVAGFVASTPGGLGVREQLLQMMLASSLGPKAVTAAILLRVIWTVSELIIAALITAAGFYWIKPRPTDRKVIEEILPHESTRIN